MKILENWQESIHGTIQFLAKVKEMLQYWKEEPVLVIFVFVLLFFEIFRTAVFVVMPSVLLYYLDESVISFFSYKFGLYS